LNRVGIHSRESLDHTQIFARASQWIFAVEIRCLDNERVAVPMAARIASPLPDISRDVRPDVQRNDASVMRHLEQDHHVTRRLNNLVIAVVPLRQHRRSGALKDDATIVEVVALSGVPAADTFR
jgi:hypothetical protein